MSVVSEETKRLFGCSQCSRRFTRHENLKRHIGTSHSHKPEYHQCKYCSKQLKRQDLLKRHVKLLHKDKFELDYGKPTTRARGGGGAAKAKAEQPSSSSMPLTDGSPASPSSDDGSTNGGVPKHIPKLYLPQFQAPDIPKTYDPKLHQYYSDLPFLPPKFLTHYKDIFCDRILDYFPIFDKKSFDEEKSAASLLRAIASIGCVVTGLPTDRKLGHELWESGFSLIEVFLSEEKEERYQLDWVQATISLLVFNGLFSFDGIADEQLMIFKRLWICDPRLSKVEGKIGDNSSDFILPCQFCYYVVNTLLIMFTQNKSWYLSMSDVEGYVPELEKKMTLSQSLVQLSKEPIELKEASATSLLLICGVYELLEHDLKLKRLFTEDIQATETFANKISRILENLAESIRLYYSNISTPPANTKLDLFWCLWHAAYIRTQVPELFFERPKGDIKVRQVHGVNSPYQTLKLELSSMKRSVNEKQESWHERYLRIAPSFTWSIQQLSARGELARSEIPIERMVYIRIIFYGILLIQKMETSKDEEDTQFLKRLTVELSNVSPSSTYPLLSQTIFQFTKDKMAAEGAWHIGSRLEEILNEYANFLNQPKIRGRVV
ncbi:zf-C2H2 type zinc finger protein [Sugiyamaella lignohabitans]|uniref:Zf-C2H2 type zinc finger protein n=1 Tax=Sugiyamaella lignohabitans TaxID=796027 RepID=A0A167EM14_9ASCO|nr:zf-C2H2 type zinc finger protein [Sugiyamaella lignohabitans]ANB14236.1 zf-C2H2 type zinc finger protein [Sugiyamaella lignohabitans]